MDRIIALIARAAVRRRHIDLPCKVIFPFPIFFSPPDHRKG